MTELRINPWYQGSVMSDQDAKSLKILADNDNEHKVIVISHDCDIRSAKEKSIDYLVAAVRSKPDSNLNNTLNPRKLNLTFRDNQESEIILELTFENFGKFDRQVFIENHLPDGTLVLENAEKRILKIWLANRYGRPAFPGEFDRRLNEGKRESAHNKMKKLLVDDEKFIVAILFNLHGDRKNELLEEEPYVLDISVVFDEDKRHLGAEEFAIKLAKNFEYLIYDHFGPPEKATKIALDSCEAMSDIAVTVADLRSLDPWTVDSFCLQDGDEDEYLNSSNINL